MKLGYQLFSELIRRNYIFSLIFLSLFLGMPAHGYTEDTPDHTGLNECGECHESQSSDWANSIHQQLIWKTIRYKQGAESCDACHSYRTYVRNFRKTKRYQHFGPTHHGSPCLACHEPGKKEGDQLTADVDQTCETCHFQRDVLWGNSLKGLTDVRNFHSGVSCVNCHMNNGNHLMKVVRPDDPDIPEGQHDTCTNCHQDDNREARIEQIQEYQETYQILIGPLLEKIVKIDKALKANPGLLSLEQKAAYDDARFNALILRNDGSKGFHNFVLVLAVQATATPAIDAAYALMK